MILVKPSNLYQHLSTLPGLSIFKILSDMVRSVWEITDQVVCVRCLV